ncbi:MAG: TolC family protein, partial [bacterium]
MLVIRPATAVAQSATATRTSDTLRLSLGEAVSIAMRQSDEVGIAAAQVDVADALYGSARANVLPQLRVTSSYLHVYESARGQAVGSVFNQPNTYTANLNLSQTLFQGGRLVSATRAADRTRESARFDEREQRAQLTLQVERAYINVLFSDRITELQDRNLALASTRLAQVEQFEKAGRAARYDVLRARVERSNIEPLAIQA